MSTKRIHLANFLTAGAKDSKAYCLEQLKKGRATTLETFWKKRELVKLLDANPDVKIFLDSGAHSLLNAQVGLIGTGTTVKTDKKDKIEFTGEEFTNRLTVNQRIDYASKKSGAVQFFADWSFNKNKDVRKYLDEYIEFIHKYKNQLTGYVNLDIIYNAEESWENQKYMEENGLRPIPVFHYGEDFKWWKYYVDNYDYVGIGGVAGGITLQQFTTSLGNKAFEYIAKTNPRIKVHGFAVTSVNLIKRFSFFSVDSVAGNSMLLIKDCGRIRLETIENLYHSCRSKDVKQSSGHTYRNVDEVEIFVPDNTGKGLWRKVNKIIRHNTRKTKYIVKSRKGRKLELTKDHGLFIQDKEKIKCIPTEKLTTNHHVVGVNYSERFGDRTNIIVEIEKRVGQRGYDKKTTTTKLFPIKVNLDNSFMEFLGLWIADGSYSSKGKWPSVQLSVGNDKECLSVVKKIASRFHKEFKLDKNGIDAAIHSVELVRIMQAIGFRGHSSTKEIPWWVFELTEDRISSFLKGYFSGDGTIDVDVECSTVSRKLLYGVFYLLTKLLIDVRIEDNFDTTIKRYYELYSCLPCHNLGILDIRSLRIFKDKIGFLQRYKQNKLIKRIQSISEERGIRSLKKENIVYLKVHSIKSIKSKQSFVYDLEVKDGQRFVANGLLVHNSTTWLKHAAYGNVMIPKYNLAQKRFDYNSTPFIASVSDVSMIKSSKHSHYTIVFPSEVVKRIEEYFVLAGVDTEQLKISLLERQKVNIYYYEQLLKDKNISEFTDYKGDKSFF